MADGPISRRAFCKCVAYGAGAAALGAGRVTAANTEFKMRYAVASCMYGCLKLDEIVPEVPKCGAEYIDLWPKRHGDQREQMEAMGHEAFRRMLAEHKVKLGMTTRYDLGPFGLQDEMPVVQSFGGRLIVSGSRGPKGLTGGALKQAVATFAEQMKPHVTDAEKHGITIGIENHGNALIMSPDSMRWLAEYAPSKHIGIALAPYHLPQDPALLAKLIEDLGDHLVHFYAWQHGVGCHEKRPKDQELLQMPGRGDLDFAPLLAALRKIDYSGWTEIFMHPVPRGIPILATAAEVTAEINRARRYLDTCLTRP